MLGDVNGLVTGPPSSQLSVGVGPWKVMPKNGIVMPSKPRANMPPLGRIGFASRRNETGTFTNSGLFIKSRLARDAITALCG